jgi:hypothetical protein
MKRDIEMRALIGILALTMMTSAYADDYVCLNKDIPDVCQEGDVLHVLQNRRIITDYCKIDTIKILSERFGGLESDKKIGHEAPLIAVCIYRGEKRKYR